MLYSQDAFAAAGFFEEITPLLRRHAARYLRHRDQQRQRTVGAFDGLIGAADRPAVDHGPREGFAAGKMEIGEDQLVAADELVLGSDGLLDLDNHFGPGIDLFDRGEHLSPHTYIIIIGKTAVYTGRSLHINLVAPLHELLSARRGKSNAILIVLDLFWNTDNHGFGSFRVLSPLQNTNFAVKSKKIGRFFTNGSESVRDCKIERTGPRIGAARGVGRVEGIVAGPDAAHA